MARITLGPNVTDIRGKFGSIVYSIWKTGRQYMRQAANVINNPHSTNQMAIRDRLTLLSKRWYDTLDDAKRAGWNDWALTKPGMGNGDGGVLTVIKGNGGIMSGFNAYILANQWLNTIGQAIVDDAPLGLTPPSAPTLVSATWNVDRLDLIWTAPITMKADAKVRLWIAHRNQLLHKQFVWAEDALLLTRSLYFALGSGGAAVLVKDYPGEYILQMDAVDIDGTKSPGGNTLIGVVPVT